MRKREREKIVGRITTKPDPQHGQSVHVRPYLSDEKKLEEIARNTGEAKSAIVRRMIRFALSDKQDRFGANRCQDRLDWLIEQHRQSGRYSATENDSDDEILNRIGRLEENLKVSSHKTWVFLRELYAMSSISTSTMNILLTRLIELGSPDAEGKKQSVLVAGGTMIKLIAHAVHDLDKCAAFHGIDPDDSADDLYLATRIK